MKASNTTLTQKLNKSARNGIMVLSLRPELYPQTAELREVSSGMLRNEY
jgi:hypothetical protein